MNLPKDSNLSFFERVFSSLFHSISAFCNAGFSLFPNGLAETYFKSAKVYLVIIMILITLGGMGFPVVTEISKKIFSVDTRLVKLSILSKFVLLISFIFLLMGSIAYFILEQKYSLKNLTLFNQIFHSVFYSVTTRTAGFNTLSISSMGVPMVFVSFLLMWVGASPNSTGGGIKTSTFAVSILSILGMIKGKDRLEIFKREISPSSVTRASATIVLSLFVIFIAIFSIVLVESFSFLDICYEVVSAYGTVGLTRGITPLLSTPSKIVIAIVMFMGRVGVLTILIAFTPKSKDYKHRYPMEYVVVG
jgi:Trk-type K+ transport system membrane component